MRRVGGWTSIERKSRVKGMKSLGKYIENEGMGEEQVV